MLLQESMTAQESLITAEEFETSYTALVAATVEGRHARGLVAERCSYDWTRCRGWVLGYQSASPIPAPDPIDRPE
jgi:hypothetical protein